MATFFRILILAVIIVCWSSCSSKKFLQADEYLINKNEIRIHGKHLPSAEKTRIRDLVETRIPLTPNANFFFFFPKERSTLKYRFASDTPGITSLIMKLDGELPALVDTARISDITTNLKNTLRSEGYFNATTDFEILFKSKTARVIYHLYPNKIYQVDSAIITSVDSNILQEIDRLSISEILPTGSPVSSNLRENEARRIAAALRDKGFYDFSPGLFSRFYAKDTSDHKVDLEWIIYPPPDDSVFRPYTIGEIYIYPGYDADLDISAYRDSLISGYHFRTVDGAHIMKPKFIVEKLAVKKGDLYSYRDFRKTILQLNTLDIFKTPRITIQKRDDSTSILDYHIQLSKEKKFEDELGFENFVSSFGRNQLLFGVSLNGSRRIKNIFKGSETFSINLDGSIESSFNNDDNQNITTLGIGFDILAPRYKDWLTLGGLRLLPGMKSLITDEFISDLNTLGEQVFNVQFNFEDYQSFYQATSIKASRGVNLSRGKHNFGFVFQDIDLLSPVPGSNFDDLVGENQVFKLSFQKQLVTGFLFRSFNYVYNAPQKNKKSFNLYFGFEASGHEIALINSFNKNSDNTFKFNADTFRFSQFIKTEIEPKFTHHFNRNSSIAFRLGVGVAIPFADGLQVPYNELFSLGGSYSLRGWRNRDIGPGGLNNSNTATPFVADQFKLELSSEYRFDLGWIMEGAVFAEAGNVWSLKKDALSITKPSLETLAVDAGIGLRFDLTFFLFRLDLAFPVRNWYPDEIDGSYWNTDSWKSLTSDPNATIGINYPF